MVELTTTDHVVKGKMAPRNDFRRKTAHIYFRGGELWVYGPRVNWGSLRGGEGVVKLFREKRGKVFEKCFKFFFNNHYTI